MFYGALCKLTVETLYKIYDIRMSPEAVIKRCFVETLLREVTQK